MPGICQDTSSKSKSVDLTLTRLKAPIAPRPFWSRSRGSCNCAQKANDFQMRYQWYHVAPDSMCFWLFLSCLLLPTSAPCLAWWEAWHFESWKCQVRVNSWRRCIIIYCTYNPPQWHKDSCPPMNLILQTRHSSHHRNTHILILKFDMCCSAAANFKKMRQFMNGNDSSESRQHNWLSRPGFHRHLLWTSTEV